MNIEKTQMQHRFCRKIVLTIEWKLQKMLITTLLYLTTD